MVFDVLKSRWRQWCCSQQRLHMTPKKTRLLKSGTLEESLVPSTNTFDPPLALSLDIFYASPRQVEDEQVDDELPH